MSDTKTLKKEQIKNKTSDIKNKTSDIKNKTSDIKNKTSDIHTLIARKITFFQDVIQKTILHVQKNKLINILSIADVNHCANYLYDLSKKIQDVDDITDTEPVINTLQFINNELSGLFKTYGTESLEDLLWVCFGNSSTNAYILNDTDKAIFDILKKYFHPTSYRLIDVDKTDKIKVVVDIKTQNTNPIDEIKTDTPSNLEIIDLDASVKHFHFKAFGFQLIVNNPSHTKSLIITGILDDVIINILTNKFINNKIKSINDNKPDSVDFNSESFERYVSSLTLKDLLLYSNNVTFYDRYMGYVSNLNNYRQKTISQLVRDFISHDLFEKRNIIMQLLIRTERADNEYLAYLLYDLLTNDVNGSI